MLEMMQAPAGAVKRACSEVEGGLLRSEGPAVKVEAPEADAREHQVNK